MHTGSIGNKMKIDWIEDLIALLERNSIVDASSARNISQSAFSRRIQALETIMDVDLIDRNTKPNQPSVALRNNESQLRDLSALQRRLINQIQQEGRCGSRLVVLACQHGITTTLGPKVVAATSQHSKVHVRLKSANFEDCEILLLTSHADFSFTYSLPKHNAQDKKSLTHEAVIAKETLIPIYCAKEVDQLLREFEGGTLKVVTYPSDVFLGEVTNSTVLSEIENNCRIDVIAETALTLAAKELSKSGMGLSWVPKSLAKAEIDNMLLVDLSHVFGSVEMNIVVKRRRETLNNELEKIWASFKALSGDEE